MRLKLLFLSALLNRIACYSVFCFVCLLQHGHWPYSTYIRTIHHYESFPAVFMYLRFIDSIGFSGQRKTKHSKSRAKYQRRPGLARFNWVTGRNDVVFRQTSHVMRFSSKSPELPDSPGVALPSCSPPVTPLCCPAAAQVLPALRTI